MKNWNLADKSIKKALIPIPGVFSLGLLILCVSVTTPVFAVSYVDFINGSPKDFMLTLKDGNREEIEEIEEGLRLENGDTIKVLKKTSSVQLMLDGKNITVTFNKNNPCVIGSECTKNPKRKLLKVSIAFWNRLFGAGRNAIDSATKSQKKTCQSESSVLDIPMLKKRKAVKLSEGEKRLYVGWKGGCSPYEVYLYLQKENGSWTKILHQNNIKSTNGSLMPLKEVKLGLHTFKPGENYRVKVCSGQCEQQTAKITNKLTEAMGYFTVVSYKQKPQRKYSDPFQQALELAKHDEWKLEAYQKVSGPNKIHSDWVVRFGLAEDWDFNR
jgi:predicted DNA-binding antitoxin AbrB/MazE fold protein